MPKAKLTSKGQITLPKAVRESLNLKPGDEVDFVEERGVIRMKKHLGESRFAQFRGILDPLPDGMTVDEFIDEIRGHDHKHDLSN